MISRESVGDPLEGQPPIVGRSPATHTKTKVVYGVKIMIIIDFSWFVILEKY